ncbi:hypothetical protein GOODEAATRI_001259 [Goodea atripinnis]|uniref:Cyclin-A2 n=1 Tax=Goodea atripinnis TaxID=208336 RepID=A0ABV0MEF7_9TELE
MSAANRQGSAASENHNQENMLTRLRGSLKPRAATNENQENLPPKQVANRTVLGGLQNNQRSKAQNQRGAKQEASQPLSCKNGDFAKSCFERLPTRQPAFQIHVDEPDAASTKKEVESSKAKSTVAESPLALSNAVARLRQPLATIDVPSSMDVGFGSPMDMSLVEGDEKPVNVNEVPEYAAEIHTYLREMEVKTRPKAGYMKKQPDITNSMRAILVDWLVEVGEEYKLQNETLYLAVNYIDRFLSSMSVLRGKLQLVGTAAMLLASYVPAFTTTHFLRLYTCPCVKVTIVQCRKFEEIYPPEVAEFVYITDDTYTKKQVLRMEHLVLKVLSFDLAAPTINQFLTQYFCNQAVNKQVESLAMVSFRS